MRTVAIILILAMVWAVGLMAFAARVDRSTPADDPQPADAIVALTGVSAVRITSAVRLLEQGEGRRLLVSGVNPEVTRSEMKGVAKAGERLFDCCVDLGFRAADTIGNGRETAAWARAHGYKSLIVVTADFHMPRAILELKSAMPGVRLTPYPVKTEELDAGHWMRTGVGQRRMIVEYCKYLVILGRESFLSLGPRDRHPAAGQTEAKAPA